MLDDALLLNDNDQDDLTTVERWLNATEPEDKR